MEIIDRLKEEQEYIEKLSKQNHECFEKLSKEELKKLIETFEKNSEYISRSISEHIEEHNDSVSKTISDYLEHSQKVFESQILAPWKEMKDECERILKIARTVDASRMSH
jgi:hypothetical protein